MGGLAQVICSMRAYSYLWNNSRIVGQPNEIDFIRFFYRRLYMRDGLMAFTKIVCEAVK